ncbi:hypothetical protein V8C43DRAFT_291736 [Trichoderma afarasin]
MFPPPGSLFFLRCCRGACRLGGQAKCRCLHLLRLLTKFPCDAQLHLAVILVRRPFCPQSPVQSSPAPSSAVRRAYYRTGPKSWFQSGTTETSGRAGLVSLALKMPQRRRQAVSNHTPNFLHHQHPQMQMSLTPRQFQRAQGSPIATPPTPRLPKTDA